MKMPAEAGGGMTIVGAGVSAVLLSGIGAFRIAVAVTGGASVPCPLRLITNGLATVVTLWAKETAAVFTAVVVGSNATSKVVDAPGPSVRAKALVSIVNSVASGPPSAGTPGKTRLEPPGFETV